VHYVVYILFIHQQLHLLLNLEKSAQQTAHTPFHDMLPHLHTIYDIILLNVLKEI